MIFMAGLIENLKGKLDSKTLELVPRSFDIIGSIAILDIPEKISSKSKLIAKILLDTNPNIKTVLKKEGRIKGRLRTRKLAFIAGFNTKEALHRESGGMLKLDVEKCYFSPRLSNDRLDLTRQVKKGERILVMFSGIAPHAVVISKNAGPKEVYAVELNKTATRYAQENARLNKLSNVRIIQGDVSRVIPQLKRKKIFFDRIIMSRPQLKNDFLDTAFKVARKGTVIHFYDFLYEEEMPRKAFEKISHAAKKSKIRIKIIRWKKALEIGPRKWRVRVDFKLI